MRRAIAALFWVLFVLFGIAFITFGTGALLTLDVGMARTWRVLWPFLAGACVCGALAALASSTLEFDFSWVGRGLRAMRRWLMRLHEIAKDDD